MATDEPTVGQLFAAVSRDLSSLVRSEIELAKAELKDDAVSAAKGGGMFGAAAFLGVLVVILLSIAAAYGLTALGLHPGWAFLIVAGFYLLVAGVLVLIGARSFKQIKSPERTIKTAKDSAALLKSDARAQVRAEVARR
jgi:membrane protein implicated in regulation of membrane protease activity